MKNFKHVNSKIKLTTGLHLLLPMSHFPLIKGVSARSVKREKGRTVY